MTVRTSYFNWQKSGIDPKQPPYHKIVPALEVLKDYCMKRWPLMNLGDHYDRAVRGGTSWSDHAYGVAWDARYENPGPGRNVFITEIVPFLIDFSLELGVNTLNDYKGDRIWQPGRGWKAQNGSGGSGMGEEWAGYFHVAIHPDAIMDGRSIEEKLGLVASPIDPVKPIPSWNPTAQQYGLWPLNPSKPTLQTGAIGDAVKYLQAVIKYKMGGGLVIDGHFGQMTTQRVREVQKFFGLKVDGIVGPKTWGLIDWAQAGFPVL